MASRSTLSTNEPSPNAATPGGSFGDDRSSGAEQRRQERRSLRESSVHRCLVVLSAAALLAFLPLWAPLMIASWMAIVVRPLHTKLAKKGGRSRAAGVVTVLLVVAALAPLLLLVLSLTGAALTLVERLQQSGGAREALSTFAATQPSLSGGQFEPSKIMEFAQKHGGGALNAAGTIFGAASAAFIALFVFVYGFYTCLVDGRSGYAWLLDHSPLERWQTARLAAAYEETGRGLLVGVGLTALFQGVVATIGYIIIGVPQALVLGLVTAFAALIPSIGTGLVWVPVMIGLFLAGKTGAGVAVLALGCVVSVADNFARPVLSRYAKLDLSTFVLLVAMLGGIGVFGTWGLLAGPLFVRLAIEALRLARERREVGESGDLVGSTGGSALQAPGQ